LQSQHCFELFSSLEAAMTSRLLSLLLGAMALALAATAAGVSPWPGVSLSSAAAVAACRRGGLELAATGGSALTPAVRLPPGTVIPNTTTPVSISGDAGSTFGVFDPSTVRAAGGPVYMTYSSVPAPNGIRTRLARQMAPGAWAFLTEVNAPFNASLPGSGCPGGVCNGTVVHEVSTLLEDVGDPDPARRIKVLAHTYLVGDDGQLHYDIGHISLFTAPSWDAPGPWPREPLLGWAGQSPFSSAGVAQVLTDIPALADCLAFTEPGALAPSPGNGTGAEALLLALGCVFVPPGSGGVAAIRIELLASGDHAASFAHAGLLLSPAVALALGFSAPQVNAAALVRDPASGRLFLSATPAMAWGYAGCLIFEVGGASPGGGVLRWLNPGAQQFSGACTAAPPSVGWMLPMLFPAPSPPAPPTYPFHFAILPSDVAPP